MGKIMYESKNERVPGVYVYWCEGCECCHAIYTINPNTLGAMWSFNGNMEKPTIQPSVLVRWNKKDVPQVCHTFITDGMVNYLGDCTHRLAGQTIPMISLDDVRTERAATDKRIFVSDEDYIPTKIKRK